MGQPKVGLALGSGGARGFAHIGVLKVLEEAGVHIDYIAGSSMGALVAALYGSGVSVRQMARMAVTFRRKYYLDFTVPKMGFVSGKKLHHLLKTFTRGMTIEQLSPKIAVVATDLLAGKKVVFTSGSAADAVRASIAIPGIIVPVKKNGTLFVDGGVIDRVPVSVVKEMGADYVIAVDVSSASGQSEVYSIFDVILQSIDIMQHELVKYQEIRADIMIKPPVKQFSSRAFTNAKEMIAIGEEEAKKHLQSIIGAIDKRKES